MEYRGNTFVDGNSVFIKQEVDSYSPCFSVNPVKKEPLDTYDDRDDLSGFDPHAWALDHLKTEIAEEQNCSYRFGSETAYPDYCCSFPNYGYMQYQSSAVFFKQMPEEVLPQQPALSLLSPPPPPPLPPLSPLLPPSQPPPPLPPYPPVPCCENAWLSKEKQFHCDVCHKNFSTKGNLGNHMRSHTQEKPFRCSVCGRCFSFNCNLKTHYLTHTGVKPFQCSVCGKCFSTKGNMSVHLRIHTGERPFKCTVCFKTFTVKDNLQRHMKVHLPLSI